MKASPYVLTLLLIAAALAFGQLAVGPVLDPMWFARPSAVGEAIGRWFAGGTIWIHLLTTIGEIAIGFAIGVAVAVPLAFALSLDKRVAETVMPFLFGFYSLPKVALAPVFILLLGVGLESKIAQVALNVVFIVFVNVYTGLTSTNRRLVDTLTLMGASSREVWLKVKLPASLAWLLGGMRISARYALSGAIVVELFTSNRGMGFLLASATARLDAARVFAALTVLALLGLAMTTALQALERRVLEWRLE